MTSEIELDELRRRLDEDDLTLLDVRTAAEFAGSLGHHCDPRQGHIPGARNVPLDRFLSARSVDELRTLVDAPPGSEVVAYCHSGARSAYAADLLRAAGYEARNYVGSWHEWSSDPSLAVETSSAGG